MYEVIMFDLFYTLINTRDNEEEKIHESDLIAVERELWTKVCDLQVFERSIGTAGKPFDIIKKAVHVLDPNADDEFINSILSARVERIRRTLIDVNTSNIKVLYRLKEMGFKLCLISNADVIDIIPWDESPLRDIFDEVIFSCDVGVAKPNRQIYEVAMNRLDVVSNNCIFVGDGGSSELKGAKEVGIDTILTTQYRGLFWPDTIKNIRQYADYEISDLSQLLDIVLVI